MAHLHLQIFNFFTIRGGSRIPLRRGAILRGAEAPTYYFAKFSEKLHGIMNILGLGVAPLRAAIGNAVHFKWRLHITMLRQSKC